jgi:hypothetical protein
VNWEAISAIGQIVGASAVVISLIYLAKEIRSNARSARVASERSLVQMLIRLTQQLAEHPHLTELWYRGLHDFESLEGAERIRFSALIRSSWHRSNSRVAAVRPSVVRRTQCNQQRSRLRGAFQPFT